MTSTDVPIREASIKLGQFLKLAGLIDSGSDAKPLATVEIGVGNAGDGTEGAVQGNVIGTYPHGPVLARNPELADHVLSLALGTPLAPLPDVQPAHDGLRREREAFVRSRG